ncbi:MAG: ATP-binding cassette domain-containing protein [Candidatus Latescibacterota bacterium]|nr:MAG: ATP-binding cassette domain-containing protein [Candidatus Latescibacterota bacterium]
MIEVRHLSKRFGTTVAVRDVSFDVARGEVVGFLGPNGAGKSTTMRVLTGYIPPTEGTARVAGHDIIDDSLAVRRRIGYLPESAPLYGDMEVVAFLRFVADVRGIAPGETRERIARMVKVCGLEKVVGRPIQHLSRGYRQRVGLAQAMIHDPDILILDEPTSGLDPNQIIEIRELIREIGREKTVILSTHILPEVSQVCGRVIIISDGSIVASGSPHELTRGAGGSGIVRFAVRGASQGEIERKLAEAPFVVSVRHERTADGDLHDFIVEGREVKGLGENLFRFAVANSWTLADLHVEAASLEEVFRRLTRGETA